MKQFLADLATILQTKKHKKAFRIASEGFFMGKDYLLLKLLFNH